MDSTEATNVSKLRPTLLNLFEQVKDCLVESGGMPFFKLIINPDDYQETKRNALDMSFLALKKVLVICMGDDGLPVVHLPISGVTLPFNLNLITAHTCIFNERTFKSLTKYYDIKQPKLVRKKDEQNLALLAPACKKRRRNSEPSGM